MDAAQQDALRPHHLRNYTAAAGVTDEQYVQFVTSDAFADVPIVWLGVALLTRMMTAHSTRRIKQGDVTDIDAMAAYLPYCDVYGADRFMAELARSLKVPELSIAERTGLQSSLIILTTRLGALRRQCAEAVYLRCGQRLYSFSFFHKLGTQAKRAENRYGEWIELFGFDDGRMPRYEMRQVPGVAAPFCGRMCSRSSAGHPTTQMH
jgi:hypothetical protein